MKIAVFSTSVAVMISLLWAGSSTAWGQEASPSDLALQAAGGLAGSVVGGLLGLVASIPVVVPAVTEPPECLPELFQAARPPEPEKRQEVVLFSLLCLAQVAAPGVSAIALSSAGSALGTLTGIVLVAKAQEREGNWIAAGVGILAGYAASSYWAIQGWMADFRELEERLRRKELQPEMFSPDLSFFLQSLIFTLLPIVLGVLGFNFL